MNNVVDVFAGVNDSFFKTVNGEILGCGSDGKWQLMLEDAEKTDLFPPAKTTIPNNVTFCILGNSKSVVFFGVEPPPNIPNRNVDFSKLVIRPNIQFQQLTNQKATPRKIVNKPKRSTSTKHSTKLPELEKENQKLREEINKLTDQNNSIEDIESFILSIKDKIQTEKGKTIIHWACENNRPDIVEYAISKKTIDINSVCTSLQSSGNAKKIDMSYEKTALHSAIENNNIDIVKMLLSSPEIDVNAHYKCKNCELVIGLQFVEEDYKKTALHLAIENNNIDIVKVLVSSSEFDCNAYYKYRSMYYMLAGLFNCSVDNYEKTALHLAIENNNIGIVNFLISLPKIDVNAYYKHSDYEKTALHLAIENNNIDIVKILLSSPEIDVNAYYKHINSKKNTTALHMAVENKYIEIIACLLESKRIDVNKKDGQGRKPFEITNDPKIRSLF